MVTGLLLELQQKLPVLLLMYARISPIFLILPILNNSVLSNTVIRNATILALVIGLWHTAGAAQMSAVPGVDQLDYLFLAGKEIVVGASIGFVMSLPFWIFNAVGGFIDLSRGSSMGSMLDPTSGQESTEMQNFINYCVCVVFLELGGFKVLLQTLVSSYQNVAIGDSFAVNLNFVLPFLAQVFEEGFVFASPVLLSLLLVECLLGLLARFTPQLNAFSVSMTIKSVIALFILSLYFWQFLPDKTLEYMNVYSQWHLLQGGGKS